MPWRVCLFAGFAILLYRGVGWVFLRYYAGIWVEVCGELASSPLAMPVLLGLGVDELSVSVPVISAMKVSISRLTMGEAQAIAGEVLRLNSAPAVRDYVADQLE